MQWYEAEVRALEHRLALESLAAPRPPAFYGSSSVRLWETLAEDVGPGIATIGFGGSTLAACDHFFNRLVPPVRPRSLLIYAGDNDLGDGRTPEQVFASFQSISVRVAATLGGIPLGFISIKPSPARFQIIDRIRRTNAMVRQYIECLPSGYYIDIVQEMLTESGAPRKDLYQADGLHLNRDGYRLWGAALKPHLHKIFTK